MPRKRRILVVDDNPVNLAIAEEILGDIFHMKFAQTGAEALRLAANFEPMFVLLDVMMPGMDGLEVCRQLRQTPGMADAVVIMVSAKAMPSEQVAGIRAGADEYITKPFDEVELLALLRRFVEAHNLKARGVEVGAACNDRATDPTRSSYTPGCEEERQWKIRFGR